MPRPFTKAKGKYGFTLVELMIVVSIIGLMAGVLLFILKPEVFAGRTRDAHRVTAIKSIQTALSLYQADNRTYPTLVGGTTIGDPVPVDSSLLGGYGDAIPVDPKPATVADPSTNGCFYNGTIRYTSTGYYYVPQDSGGSYLLFTTLEDSAADQPCGTKVVGPYCYCTHQ